jgi:hypothetical protein
VLRIRCKDGYELMLMEEKESEMEEWVKKI